ncbi:hypothetical protein Pan216_54330 [Planctomycetes bacterium Pan216]|uniref:Uncharacterized protein n=1 Tax=Kolteria novifilia TaxID=2527975 RepID=A0A518BCC1_9BACT|nr:hypothetical protein Pan216_54330 [Planctomycetes bacterium Pan216]
MTEVPGPKPFENHEPSSILIIGETRTHAAASRPPFFLGETDHAHFSASRVYPRRVARRHRHHRRPGRVASSGSAASARSRSPFAVLQQHQAARDRTGKLPRDAQHLAPRQFRERQLRRWRRELVVQSVLGSRNAATVPRSGTDLQSVQLRSQRRGSSQQPCANGPNSDLPLPIGHQSHSQHQCRQPQPWPGQQLRLLRGSIGLFVFREPPAARPCQRSSTRPTRSGCSTIGWRSPTATSPTD